MAESSGIHPRPLLAAVNRLELALLAKQDPAGRLVLKRGNREPLEGHASRDFHKVEIDAGSD